MKIGIFDSGFGGLLLLKSIVVELPSYDYVYLGDTKNVPYGNRSQKDIYEFTKRGVKFLAKKNCKLIILACNTASSRALRKIQREYLPKYFPNIKVLGVIIPTSEVALNNVSEIKIGVIGTLATVKSLAFIKELKKINAKVKVYQKSAPLLVPMIESNDLLNIKPILEKYIRSFIDNNVDAIILGCTHYSLIKNIVRAIVGRNIRIVSQDELIPNKLKSYLNKHLEIKAMLTQNGKAELVVTKITSQYMELSKRWFGAKIKILKVTI